MPSYQSGPCGATLSAPMDRRNECGRPPGNDRAEPRKRSGDATSTTRRHRTRFGGPKGIRTPDLLAASQNRVNGVLTCVFAGHERAESMKLWGVAGPHPSGRDDPLLSREVVGGRGDALEKRRIRLPYSLAVGTRPRRDADRLPTLGHRTPVLVTHSETVAVRDRSPPCHRDRSF
jgi:hypothetical protein